MFDIVLDSLKTEICRSSTLVFEFIIFELLFIALIFSKGCISKLLITSFGICLVDITGSQHNGSFDGYDVIRSSCNLGVVGL